MTSLPNDVLYDIFLRITMRAHELTTFEADMIEPLFLSHVCRRWRQVALSHGTLWSYLCITKFGEPGTSHRECTIEIFHTWLKRSNNAPLTFSVSFRVESEEDVEGRRQMELVVKSLISEQQRWRDVYFIWEFMAYSSELRGIELTNMPILSSITLGTKIKTCDGARIIPHINISRSPQLEVMKLTDRSVIETGEDPVHSLGRAYYEFSHEACTKAAADCLNLLKVSPNLEDFNALHDTLDIDAVGHDTRHQKISESYTRFVHNSIWRLGLWSPNSDVPALIIDRLTLPELHILELRTDMMPGSHHILIEFIERSLPRLQKLEIWGYNAISDNLIPVLRMLPTLKKLVIGGCDDADELFEGLARGGEEPITCPALRKIRLVASNLHDEALDALHYMAESRGREGSVSGTVIFNEIFRVPTSHILAERDLIWDTMPPESEEIDLCILLDDTDLNDTYSDYMDSDDMDSDEE